MFNLNEDTDDLGAEEEEVQEVRPRARTYLRIKRHSPSSFEIFTAHALVKRADALGAIEIEETNVCTIKREELELKHQVIQFKHEVKMDKDIMFCNELDDHLTIQLAADDISAQVSVVQNPQLYRVLIPETTFVGVESRVLIPETTFVGVESRVLIPETTFVGVESRVLIPEMTVWDTLVYPSDTLVILPTGIVESDSEVEVVFDETANLRIPTSGKDRSDKGYGTNSLLEQWRDSYPDNDDYDPYNDDMYENHDLSEHLQSICDDFDIKVRDRKKK
ncbi:hypothetical protein Tco_0388938 [Tanacetum coccineum]